MRGPKRQKKGRPEIPEREREQVRKIERERERDKSAGGTKQNSWRRRSSGSIKYHPNQS